MDSMSSQDATFLYLDNEFNHMHIAVVAIFEGPAPEGREIEEMIEAKLHHVPRYRQCVRSVPFDLGQPVWVDDDQFDLAYHVRHTALPTPGSEERLHDLVGRVMSQKLDARRPLWEIWVVEGLADGRWALLSKTHHCLMDGISGSDLLSVLLDDAEDVPQARPQPWNPRPAPNSVALTATALTRGMRWPRSGMQALGRAFGAPRRALSDLSRFTEALASFRSLSEHAVERSLNGPIGPHRRWCTARTTLADIGKIRSAHGGTVNDVVLSVVARGFRSLLIARGEPIAGHFVRSLVPISLRKEDERGIHDNRVAGVFVDLPMETADPVARLAAIRSAMDESKEQHQADVSEGLTVLSGQSPPALLALGARLFAGLEQHLVQTVATNVPGPRHPLFAAGRRMLEAYPYVPLAGSVRIGVAIFSYAGGIGFGVTGDYESSPDIAVLATGIEDGIAELLAAS